MPSTSGEPADLALPVEGRYQVEREIGRGGMAVVYLAIDRKQNRKVALKVLHPEVAAAIGFDRFRREIEFAAKLSHPHLLPLFDAGLTTGPAPRPYYVMPYLEGESLRELLLREGQVPVDDAIRIATEVAGALAYAHGQGIIHRDIKPENILLSSGSAVVADFGIARALESATDPRLTETGVALGTPQYMSPEQALGERTLDGRTDLYALGAVLYEMLAGEPPFTGPTAQVVVARALAQPAPSLLGIRHLPAALDGIVRKALEKSPADRYRTAEAMALALGAVETTPAEASQARWPGRSARWLGGAVVAGLVIALGTYAFQRLTRESTLDQSLIAIVPFDGAAIRPDLHLWREGLTDVLSRNLDGAGTLRTVSPTRVVRAWQGNGDRATARDIARRTGAGLAIYGRIVDLGPDSVRLEASLLNVVEDRILAEVEVRQPGDRMDRASDSLTVALIRELGRTRAVGSGRLASIGSHSLPAIRAFLRGEAFFRRTSWDSAAYHYHRAIELDSTFALAVLRAGQVLGWQRLAQDQLSHEYLLRAGTLNHGLAPRDSLLILADSLLAALYRVDDPLDTWRMTHRLAGLLRNASERFSDDPEVWHRVGEAGFHWGLDVGGSGAETMAAFERAIALDSTFGPSYIHLIPLAGRHRGVASGRAVARAYLRLGATDAEAEAVGLVARLLDPAEPNRPALWRIVDTTRAPVLFEMWAASHAFPDPAEVAVDIGRRLVTTTNGLAGRLADATTRRNFLVDALAYRGHLREALEMAGGARLELLYESTVLVPGGAALSGDPIGRIQPWSVAGLELRHAARDTSGLRSLLRIPVGGPGGPTAERSRGHYLHDLTRAYLASAQGDSTLAARLLGAIPDSLCPDCYLHRLHLARLLRRNGQLEGARVVLARELRKFFGGPISQVFWELERARLAEREGRTAEATQSYRFVREVWSRADPELGPFRAEADSALARLSRLRP